MTTLATRVPAPQGLVSFDTRLQLGRDEPLGVGLKRVAMDQLEHAAGGYFEGEESFGEAVHESRKAIKKVRALLRLTRGELTERIFRFEDGYMRDTGAMVAEIRSAAALMTAARLIHELYGELLAKGTFQETIARLRQRRDAIEQRGIEDPQLAGRVVRNLEKAYHRYASWPTDPDAREVYGVGIRDSYEAIQPGLLSTYRRGRNEMVGAYSNSSPERFHEWRKGAKYLRHQMEFLVPLWPEMIAGVAMTLHHLGELLGEDHDLAELVALLNTRPELCPNPRERSLFRALVEQRRHELHVAAEILGRRIYAEKPASLVARFGEYWASRQQAIQAPLDTVVVY